MPRWSNISLENADHDVLVRLRTTMARKVFFLLATILKMWAPWRMMYRELTVPDPPRKEYLCDRCNATLRWNHQLIRGYDRRFCSLWLQFASTWWCRNFRICVKFIFVATPVRTDIPLNYHKIVRYEPRRISTRKRWLTLVHFPRLRSPQILRLTLPTLEGRMITRHTYT